LIHASSGDFGEDHREYSRRFLAKHRDALPFSPSPKPPSPPRGRGAPFPDYRALIASWRRETFQHHGITRETIA
ncbi:MAG: hypothetical protein LBF61_10945, partial [Azoarcus sp.]|nr:hypothetical protein [Azoarcus sp.]